VHSYSIKHFIEQDLIHRIWHVDTGILFTIRELFTRPGHCVREFINGKRVVCASKSATSPSKKT
jgi:hypothetical protein